MRCKKCGGSRLCSNCGGQRCGQCGYRGTCPACSSHLDVEDVKETAPAAGPWRAPWVDRFRSGLERTQG